MLQNFTWKAFETTGSIDAYLLYKEMSQLKNGDFLSQNENIKKPDIEEEN